MALVKRDNSRYWYCQFQVNHRFVVRSTKTTDKRLAKQICSCIRAEVIENGRSPTVKIITVDQAIDVVVRAKAGTANHRNLLGHKRSLLQAIGPVLTVDKLTYDIITKWIDKRKSEGIKPQTIKHGLNLLSQSLKWARKQGYAVGAFDIPRITVDNNRVRYLSADEQSRLISYLRAKANEGDPLAKQGLHVAIVLLDTGARYSEIASIRWDQIDLDTNAIRLWRSKVKNESILFMTDRVKHVLVERLACRSDDNVFVKPLSIARVIRKAMRAVNLQGCTIHTLRHTNATTLIQNGMSIYEVKHVLGHSDIRTTMRYCHLEQAIVTEKAMQVLNRLNTK